MTDCFKHLARLEIPGGGQVVVDGDHAFVGHLRPPSGTTIVDVADPTRPRVVTTVEVPPHTHSHKVRIMGDLMLVNQELNRAEPVKPPIGDPVAKITAEARDAAACGFQGGLKVYDISDRSRPRPIGLYPSYGVHRFDSDDRYAYISSEEEGFLGDIVVVVDLANPTAPMAVARWWMPGQWLAGGEQPTWPGRRHRCHHPLRLGDRLYVSYWHGGFVILDVADLAHPKFVSGLDWSPPYPCPTHTALPIPQSIMGRRVLVVTDEEVADRLAPSPNAFLWTVDVTDERHPVPISTFRVPHDKPFDRDCWFGAHQPQEIVDGNIVCVTWFAGGLRAVDISDIYRPAEVGHFMPTPTNGMPVQSNDVYFEKRRGLIYVIDRLSGLDILEYRR
jgi:hypothetical protein